MVAVQNLFYVTKIFSKNPNTSDVKLPEEKVPRKGTHNAKARNRRKTRHLSKGLRRIYIEEKETLSISNVSSSYFYRLKQTEEGQNGSQETGQSENVNDGQKLR